MQNEPLFDAAFLSRVRRLRLLMRGVSRPGGEGAGGGTRKGGFLEFEEHRRYSPGDDLRFVDWNVAARSDHLFVKQYRREEEHSLCVIIDASASMESTATDRDPGKFDTARRLAAAFALIVAETRGRVRLAAARGGELQLSPVYRSAAHATAALRFLENLRAFGTAGLGDALAAAAGSFRDPSTIVVLSDLLEREDCRRSLVTLRGAGHRPVLFHLLTPAELSPDCNGPIRLVDSETGEDRFVVFGAEERRRYENRLRAFLESWQVFAGRHGMHYQMVPTDVSLSRLLFREMRRWRILS